MPLFLAQVSYTAEAMAALVSNPRDRLNEVFNPLMQELGGRTHGAWFSFGEYDVVVVYEVPDNVSAAATSMVIGAGGAVTAIKTTPLISTDEAVEAFSRAKSLSYKPPND
jgi:uncharacterized protein with GYD domain